MLFVEEKSRCFEFIQTSRSVSLLGHRKGAKEMVSTLVTRSACYLIELISLAV